MASERAIAIMRGTAVERLEKAASALADNLESVKGFERPLNQIYAYGDTELAHAKQLEAIADVLDQVKKAVSEVKSGHDERVKSLEQQLADAQTELDTLKNPPAPNKGSK